MAEDSWDSLRPRGETAYCTTYLSRGRRGMGGTCATTGHREAICTDSSAG